MYADFQLEKKSSAVLEDADTAGDRITADDTLTKKQFNFVIVRASQFLLL